MCGIVGIYNFDKKDVKDELIEMMLRLQHREDNLLEYLIIKKGEDNIF